MKKKKDKSVQNSGEEQNKVFSGELKCNAGTNFNGSEKDPFGDTKIIIRVGLTQAQINEIARLQELGNSGITLVLFTSLIESSSPEDNQKVNCNPVEQKINIDYSLTECEIIALEGLSKGFSYKQIADNRFRAENTIKRQISDAYQKIDAHNKVDASAKFRDFIKITLFFILNLEFITEIQWDTFF